MPLSDDFEIKCPDFDYNDDQLSKTVKFPAFKLLDYPTGINSPITREQTCLTVQRIREKQIQTSYLPHPWDHIYIIGLKDAAIILSSYAEQFNLHEYILSQITAKTTHATTKRLDGPQWEVKV